VKRFDVVCAETLFFSRVHYQIRKLAILDHSNTTSEAQLVERAKDAFFEQTHKRMQFEAAWHLLRATSDVDEACRQRGD
jgi:hypothetical protein